MHTPLPATLRALRHLALVAAASVAAASIWAAGLPQESYLLDAGLWKQEVARDAAHWPADGWMRLVPRERSVEVRAVRPDDGADVPDGAMYFRLPGVRMVPGERPVSWGAAVLRNVRIGQDHELTLGATRFSLRVEPAAKGMQYVVGYRGQTYTYTLSPFDATTTSVRAVADLDGDGLPDFLVDVGDDATYLLLSTQARPGANLPTAELWAPGC